MKQEYKHIEDLLERFFDGLTSNAEEKELYDFFANKDIPEHLISYKPVFGYFESGLIEELDSSEGVQGSVKHIHSARKWWITGLGVAAIILLLLSIRPLFINKPDEFNPFEGSYIIRNGECITDLELIQGELESTYQIAMLHKERAERLLQATNESNDIGEQIQQEINAQYCEIINSFPDGRVRDEVKKILDIECN